MNLQELTEELRNMECILGKERFRQLIEETLRKEFPEELEEEYDDELLFDLVTTEEWSDSHPANLACRSDEYYSDLANYLYDVIYDYNIRVEKHEILARELGRVLAAYLEDIVSGTKVFSAMRRVCKERYGYWLPFFDCEHADYMPDHINVEDIRFLIWKTAARFGWEMDKVYSPLAPGWAMLADRIFDELNSRFEEAPEATRVTDWLRRSFRKEDYTDIREIATWLVFRNPLSYRPGFLESVNEEMIDALHEDDIDPDVIDKVFYSFIASQSWQRSMSPMGCPSRTLVAALAAEFGFETLSNDIEAIEVLPLQIYALSQNKKTRHIFFETPTHEKIEVERDSLANGFRPDEIQYGKCNLVKYKGRYLLNGMLKGEPSLKAEWENEKGFLSFEQQRRLVEEWLKILDGKQVVCVANLKSLFKKLGLPKADNEFPEAVNFVVLLSKEMGMAIIPDKGYAFDLPGNRFFRKRQAERESFPELVFHNEMPHDLAVYIQKHNLLPGACIGASQGKETGRMIVQDYLAFWIGFYCGLPAYGTAPVFQTSNDTRD